MIFYARQELVGKLELYEEHVFGREVVDNYIRGSQYQSKVEVQILDLVKNAERTLIIECQLFQDRAASPENVVLGTNICFTFYPCGKNWESVAFANKLLLCYFLYLLYSIIFLWQ